MTTNTLKCRAGPDMYGSDRDCSLLVDHGDKYQVSFLTAYLLTAPCMRFFMLCR